MVGSRDVRTAKLETDVSEIKIAFRIPAEYPTPNFAPSWNVAPTDNLPIVRYDQKAGSRTLDLMRWGLVPYWAKDIKIGFSTINAMAETVDTKPVFREAFQRRRCTVRMLADSGRDDNHAAHFAPSPRRSRQTNKASARFGSGLAYPGDEISRPIKGERPVLTGRFTPAARQDHGAGPS